ncbi:hypothetical protein [Chengkuizengella sediminis]|uniref:hypothetical protein n=1 Tax=Chengkuizengella sediminis TaxID=1885917 RepID=UPI001389FDE4|nr:hypothetical protein [Chengkuizengella sediminis]NDI35372.1 hypothetical protein [Chengkuizengella sediminis]
MNNELFIDRIKTYVRDAAVEDVILKLNKPPGRKQDKNMSYNQNGITNYLLMIKIF